MRWLAGITDSIGHESDQTLGDSEAWHAAVHGLDTTQRLNNNNKNYKESKPGRQESLSKRVRGEAIGDRGQGGFSQEEQLR